MRRALRRILKRTPWREHVLYQERYEQALTRLKPARAWLGDITALARQVADQASTLSIDYGPHTLHSLNEPAALYHVLNSLRKMEKMVAALDLAECATVLDVGANSGWFAHFLLRRYPQARVWCFEPDPVLHPLIELNRPATATLEIVERAVSARSGETLAFYINPESRQTSSTERDAVSAFAPAEPVQRRDVSSIALDDFVADHALDKVDVLKIDIQGGEYAALTGAEKTLAMSNTLFAEISFLDHRILDTLDLLRRHFSAFEVINEVSMGADLRWYNPC